MSHLDRAISLYRDEEKVKELKTSYKLAEDKQEKQAIRVSLLNLGHRVEDK
jgi:hypothetical protein